MVTTVIIALLVITTVRVVVGEEQCQANINNDAVIKSCCCLGYNNTNFNANSPGVYTIGNFGGRKCSKTKVYCDTTSGGGGWLVIQRRQDGSVDFNRDWVDYEDGFGSLTGEFWYGLRAIHTFTKQGQWELRVDYTSAERKGYLSYGNFQVGPATEDYPLLISGFDGVTSDPFSTHPLNGAKFTTRDRDNDRWPNGGNVNNNCAVDYQHQDGNAGGFWYQACSHIFPNSYDPRFGIHIDQKTYFATFVELKIRPKNCIM